ncbi:FAD:protein FMN transferase [Methylobacterium persicinum]|uniref:FAD:protein FMN transferase n=1 Tax=Methylobacterium persicinum TaxID=374426 RepID=A0ABU0HKQ6_9HYPH|nr:FAD:protein FMN transferase [Methylobacterium persicinum]MDQ0442897.1 thiamine biosynthesis lipoprotein [Methylobacterium persicinum]GJE37355.1 hypothetical protein KHHGKMAE_1411 [Methylobacterium persicinum]
MTIRVWGQPAAQAHGAIDAAFARITHVHDRMSFQCPGSDVSRLNRAGIGERLRIDPETVAVLRQAQAVARAARGVFDPTVAGDLVREGLLPAPAGARPPDPRATFDDVVLAEDGVVSLSRALWLDLSGIAKGHAVDRAIAALAEAGVTEACVNAGGDLRAIGRACPVALRTGFPDEALAVVTLEDGSLASSGGRAESRHAAAGQHRNGVLRMPTVPGRFACVLAQTCAVADALTKVVLALGLGAGDVLAGFGATAHLREPDGSWHALGCAAG